MNAFESAIMIFLVFSCSHFRPMLKPRPAESMKQFSLPCFKPTDYKGHPIANEVEAILVIQIVQVSDLQHIRSYRDILSTSPLPLTGFSKLTGNCKPQKVLNDVFYKLPCSIQGHKQAGAKHPQIFSIFLCIINQLKQLCSESQHPQSRKPVYAHAIVNHKDQSG